MLTIIPLTLVGAISDKKSSAIIVRPPAPRPPQILAKRRKPKMPDENTCINIPLVQTKIATWYDHSCPSLSLKKYAIRAPKAAPSTPKEVMLAVRFARPVWLCVHFFALRL